MLPPVQHALEEAVQGMSLGTDSPSLPLSPSVQLSRWKHSISQGTIPFHPQTSTERLLQPP